MVTTELLNRLLEKCGKLRDGLLFIHKNTEGYEISRDTLNAVRGKSRSLVDYVNQIKLLLEEAEGVVEVPRQAYAEKDYWQGKAEAHESFGTISITRPTGRVKLVGTTTDALPHFVQVRVHRAKRYIDESLHTENYFHEGPPILEFSMSSYQWAEAITGMNGVEVPVTLNYILGTEMEGVPAHVETPFERALRGAKEKVGLTDAEEKFKADVDSVIEQVKRLGLSKKKETEFVSALKQIFAEHVTVPRASKEWAIRRINEEAEQAVAHAKVEIDAALTGLIGRTGLAALQNETVMKALKEGGES
jgi:hypothetical protein